MLSAKSAAPNAANFAPHYSSLDQIPGAGCVLFSVSPGYSLTPDLARTLDHQGNPVMWLRIGVEDNDPATLLLSLVSSAQRLKGDINFHTPVLMQQYPGPVMGWPALFEYLAEELASLLPPASVIVLESLHQLNACPPTLGLLCKFLLPILSGHSPCILISHQPLPQALLPQGIRSYQADLFKVDLPACMELAEEAGIGISSGCIHQVIHMADGRLGAIQGLLFACQELGSQYTQKIVDRSKNLPQLLGLLSQALLITRDEDDRRTLALSMDLGYCHPEITQVVLSAQKRIREPWGQPLVDNWEKMLAYWSGPLNSLKIVTPSARNTMNRIVADYLADTGSIDQAIQLYLDSGHPDRAARTLSSQCMQMMDRGQWVTLEKWLRQIPASVIQDWPWLVYVNGELHTTRGAVKEGRAIFSQSTKLFSARQENTGTCQSLLAESALASWAGDRSSAKEKALVARKLAGEIGLAPYRGWADWILGVLASHNRETESAIEYFNSTANTLQNPALEESVGQVKTWIDQLQEISRERDRRQREIQKLDRTEAELAEKLYQALDSPAGDLPKLLTTFGWSQVPIMMKLQHEQTASSQHQDHSFKTRILDLGQRFYNQLKWSLISRRPSAPSNGFQKQPLGLPAYARLPHRIDRPTYDLISSKETPQKEVEPTSPYKQAGLVHLAELSQNGDHKVSAKSKDVYEVKAYLLGPFRITVNDQPLPEMGSTRSLAVLKYMFYHHTHEQNREVLMDTFWPDADPDSARNSLNVALYSLRRTFRHILDFPVVEFHQGAYRLDPRLHVWTDVEEFEHLIQAGNRLETEGKLNDAAGLYEAAINLYQNEFLYDDPYEEWPVLTRERLRLKYMDTLDRLSQTYFNRDEYLACITLCQKILERDDCREDAHCRLMRCYSRQGQRYLALRQYQVCTEALRRELDIDPDPATTALAEHVRNQDPV